MQRRSPGQARALRHRELRALSPRCQLQAQLAIAPSHADATRLAGGTTLPRYMTKRSAPDPPPDHRAHDDWAQVGVVGDTLYAVGGTGPRRGSACEAFDTSANSWHTLPAMPTPRYGLGLGVIGTQLIAVGGDSFGHTSQAVEIYETSSQAVAVCTSSLMTDHCLHEIRGWAGSGCRLHAQPSAM